MTWICIKPRLKSSRFKVFKNRNKERNNINISLQKKNGAYKLCPVLFYCDKPMNIELLELAKRRVPNASVMVNMVSKRARQLIAGNHPLIKIENQKVDFEDIALKEIAEGKIMAEIDLASQ